MKNVTDGTQYSLTNPPKLCLDDTKCRFVSLNSFSLTQQVPYLGNNSEPSILPVYREMDSHNIKAIKCHGQDKNGEIKQKRESTCSWAHP